MHTVASSLLRASSLSLSARFASSALVLAAASALVGCSGSSDSSNGSSATTGEQKADVARDTSPTVASSDSSALVSGNLDFALQMYAQLTAQNTANANLAFSPYSISAALGMTYAGAAGNTATEMAKALDFTLPAATLFPAFDALDLGLTSDAAVKGQDNQNVQLNIANSLWAAKGLELQPAFLTTLATSYGAGVQTTDFAGDPEGSRAAINQWVDTQTDDKIKTLLPEGSITASTELALVNAVAMDAPWANPFQVDSTSNGTFTTPTGAVQTPMMHSAGELSYATSANATLVELPYDGNRFAMDIVLPSTASASTFDAGFDAAAFTALTGALKVGEVDLSLPKFTFDGGTISLKEELSALGMADAFGGSADFSGMSTTPLHIDNVYHQAYISVSEAGTIAAAATAVVSVGTAAPVGSPVTVTVDHPFTFVIRDTANGAILFVGKVNTPGSAT